MFITHVCKRNHRKDPVQQANPFASSKSTTQFNFSYRDRAKERRAKYGQPPAPEPSGAKGKHQRPKRVEGRAAGSYASAHGSVNAYSAELQPSPSHSPPAAPAVLEHGIGAKMLKQMGWNDGQGLGKQNQGIAFTTFSSSNPPCRSPAASRCPPIVCLWRQALALLRVCARLATSIQ